MWMQWGGGWCISAVATVMWKTSHVPDSHVQLSHCEMKNILISSFTQIAWLWPENCMEPNNSFSALETMVVTLCLVGRMSVHIETEITPYAILSGPFELIQGWRWQFPGSHHYWWWVMVSSLWGGAKTAVQGMATRIPHQKKSSRHSSHCVMWYTLFFVVGKGWSFWIY